MRNEPHGTVTLANLRRILNEQQLLVQHRPDVIQSFSKTFKRHGNQTLWKKNRAQIQLSRAAKTNVAHGELKLLTFGEIEGEKMPRNNHADEWPSWEQQQFNARAQKIVQKQLNPKSIIRKMRVLAV